MKRKRKARRRQPMPAVSSLSPMPATLTADELFDDMSKTLETPAVDRETLSAWRQAEMPYSDFDAVAF